MKHILIIDNDKQVRIVLSQLFINEGYIVSEASGPKQGIEILKCSHIDLLIVEVYILGYNIIDLLDELKIKYPRLRFIVISARQTIPSHGYLQCSPNLRSIPGFNKPFKLEALLNETKNQLCRASKKGKSPK